MEELEPQRNDENEQSLKDAIPVTVEVSVALRKDIKPATAIITKEYRKEGYIGPGETVPISRYLLLEGTVTFVAKSGDEVVGTISMVFDDIPMETLWKNELSGLRGRDGNITLAEVCQLATDREILSWKNRVDTIIKLFSAVFDESSSRKITDLVIAVNPKHEKFYKDMKFGYLGKREVRQYEAVKADAIAMTLDMTKWSRGELLKILSDRLLRLKLH